jgi:putative CocE/NonD family hydrolase
VRKEANVPATMRDGTVLYADVYRPAEPGSYPVLLMRLPYNKSLGQASVYGAPAAYAAHCYIVVIQDVRGQYTSGGAFYPFRHEQEDGYDSVEWAAGLPQSNGKVGMYGFSYVGATQWLAATQAPPHLAAIAPGHTSSDYYDGWSYEGGAFSLAFEDPGRAPRSPPARSGVSATSRSWTGSPRRRARFGRPTRICRSRLIPG